MRFLRAFVMHLLRTTIHPITLIRLGRWFLLILAVVSAFLFMSLCIQMLHFPLILYSLI